MAYKKLASVDELPEGALVEIVHGNDLYALCNVAGEVRAMSGVCPHHGGPLGQGALEGSIVTCPWHAWQFDSTTGVCLFNHDVQIAMYPVRIEAGDILVDLPGSIKKAVPELPEVETVVRTLRPAIAGRRILNAEFLQPRVLRGSPIETARALAGRRIKSIERHGKFIAIRLDRGFLVIHLGMTGKLLVNAEPTKWTHAIFTLDQGILHYDDQRQFGRIEYGDELPDRVAALGPEPLEVTLAEFTARLRARRSPVKAVLLNQAVVRGVGNIYADEALFRAGVHPKRAAASLGKDRIERIYNAMREVLAEAIESRGSSVSNYVDADGRKGSFQTAHRVYRRTGKPCVNCGMEIKRIVLVQRGTHFCPKCQR